MSGTLSAHVGASQEGRKKKHTSTGSVTLRWLSPSKPKAATVGSLYQALGYLTHPSILGNCSCIALTAYMTHMDVGNAE